jgi:hypothetical protein
MLAMRIALSQTGQPGRKNIKKIPITNDKYKKFEILIVFID